MTCLFNYDTNVTMFIGKFYLVDEVYPVGICSLHSYYLYGLEIREPIGGTHVYTEDTFINVINIFCTFINYINMFHEKNKWSLIIPLVAIIN